MSSRLYVCVGGGGGGGGLCIIGGRCQKYHFCCDKHVLVVTNICREKHVFLCDKGFAATSILLLRPNTFVAAKMILVTAPSNDS